MVRRSNIYYSKIYLKENWKKNMQLPLEQQNIRPLRHIAQLLVWKGGLGILDIDTQKKKNYLKITWIQRWLNLTNALWKNLKLYQLNLILNSNQGLALFRQKQMLRSNRHKNLQKQNNEDFFVQLLNAWLHFTNNKFLISTHAEEVLDQPIFWNLLTGLNFNSNNSYFTISHTKLFTDKFTIIS